MEEAQRENPKALGGQLVGATASKPQQSELERFASILLSQNELIGLLDNKLGVVSDRTPQEPGDDRDRSAHLSTLIDYVEVNNRKLSKLINELVI